MNTALLEALSLAFGPCGCEDNVASLIESEIRCYTDECFRDKAGNLIAVLFCGKKDAGRVLFSAHMDEVGFMVKSVDDEGRFSVTNLGPVDTTALCGRHVLIGNEEKLTEAVFSSRAIHTQSRDDRASVMSFDKVYIEAGCEKKEASETVAVPGDFGTFKGRFHKLGAHLTGKALDGRSGCAILCEMIQKIREDRLSFDRDLYFCFTTKKELGIPGALNAANRIAPEEAIILDSALAADLPDVPAHLVCTKLGNGVALAPADGRTIYAHDLLEKARKAAESNGIPYQMKQLIDGGSDSSFIQKSGAGTKVLSLAVPCRYAHTASPVICERDYDAVLALAMQMI